MRKAFFCFLPAALAAIVCGAFIPQSVGRVSAENPVNAVTEKSINGLTYKKFEYEDNGRQTLFYGEYNPAAEGAEYEFVIHNVKNDAGKIVKTAVSDIAADYTAKTGKKVTLATNGDYFDLTSGQNMESLVMNGVVYTIGSFSTKHCLGFDNNGKAVIGRMTQVSSFLEVQTEKSLTYYPISAINQPPEEGRLSVYTSANNVSLTACGKYKFKTSDPNVLQFPTAAVSTRMVEGSVTDDKSLTLNSGEFAAVIKGENEISRFFYDNVTYGTNVRLVNKPDGEYKDMPWVIGGYSILVDNGVVNTNVHTDNAGNVWGTPRTFIGVKEDGTMFLAVLDGRQAPYSTGCSVTREAELAAYFGAKYALELDGGGSSAFLADLSDGEGLKLRNKPSDGAERKVSNAVLLVEKDKDSGGNAGGGDIPPEDNKTDDTTKTQSGCKGAAAELTGIVAGICCVAAELLKKRNGGKI